MKLHAPHLVARVSGRRKYLLTAGVAALALVASLTACSSSSKSTGGSTGSGASSAASKATGTPIKVGAIVTESGPTSSSLIPAAAAYKAWVAWTNSNGGINGHPIELTLLDDQGTPAIGLSDTKQLIDGDHVVALTCMCIGALQTMGPYATQKGVPQVGAFFVNSPFAGTLGNANVYEVDASFWAEVANLPAVAKALGGTKIGYVVDSATAGPTATAAYQATVQDAGMPWGGAQILASASPNDTAQCLAFKQNGTDTILTSLADQPMRQFMDQCATQGFKPILIGNSTGVVPAWLKDDAFSKSGGDVPQFPWFDTSNPAIAQFVKVVKGYSSTALDVNPQAAAGAWASMVVLGEGIKNSTFAGDPTTTELKAGLSKIQGNNFGGLTPTLDYSNGGNINVGLCTYATKVDGDKFTMLNNGQRMCATLAETTRIFNIELGKLKP